MSCRSAFATGKTKTEISMSTKKTFQPVTETVSQHGMVTRRSLTLSAKSTTETNKLKKKLVAPVKIDEKYTKNKSNKQSGATGRLVDQNFVIGKILPKKNILLQEPNNSLNKKSKSTSEKNTIDPVREIKAPTEQNWHGVMTRRSVSATTNSKDINSQKKKVSSPAKIVKNSANDLKTTLQSVSTNKKHAKKMIPPSKKLTMGKTTSTRQEKLLAWRVRRSLRYHEKCKLLKKIRETRRCLLACEKLDSQINTPQNKLVTEKRKTVINTPGKNIFKSVEETTAPSELAEHNVLKKNIVPTENIDTFTLDKKLPITQLLKGAEKSEKSTELKLHAMTTRRSLLAREKSDSQINIPQNKLVTEKRKTVMNTPGKNISKSVEETTAPAELAEHSRHHMLTRGSILNVLKNNIVSPVKINDEPVQNICLQAKSSDDESNKEIIANEEKLPLENIDTYFLDKKLPIRETRQLLKESEKSGILKRKTITPKSTEHKLHAMTTRWSVSGCKKINTQINTPGNKLLTEKRKTRINTLEPVKEIQDINTQKEKIVTLPNKILRARSARRTLSATKNSTEDTNTQKNEVVMLANKISFNKYYNVRATARRRYAFTKKLKKKILSMAIKEKQSFLKQHVSAVQPATDKIQKEVKILSINKAVTSVGEENLRLTENFPSNRVTEESVLANETSDKEIPVEKIIAIYQQPNQQVELVQDVCFSENITSAIHQHVSATEKCKIKINTPEEKISRFNETDKVAQEETSRLTTLDIKKYTSSTETFKTETSAKKLCTLNETTESNKTDSKASPVKLMKNPANDKKTTHQSISTNKKHAIKIILLSENPTRRETTNTLKDKSPAKQEANNLITDAGVVKPVENTDGLENEISTFNTESGEKLLQDEIILQEKEPIASEEGASDFNTKVVKPVDETVVFEKEISYDQLRIKQQNEAILLEKEIEISREEANNLITDAEAVKPAEETDILEKETSDFYTESDEKQQDEIVGEAILLEEEATESNKTDSKDINSQKKKQASPVKIVKKSLKEKSPARQVRRSLKLDEKCKILKKNNKLHAMTTRRSLLACKKFDSQINTPQNKLVAEKRKTVINTPGKNIFKVKGTTAPAEHSLHHMLTRGSILNVSKNNIATPAKINDEPVKNIRLQLRTSCDESRGEIISIREKQLTDNINAPDNELLTERNSVTNFDEIPTKQQKNFLLVKEISKLTKNYFEAESQGITSTEETNNSNYSTCESEKEINAYNENLKNKISDEVKNCTIEIEDSIIILSDDEEVETEKGRNTIKAIPKDYIVDRVLRSTNKNINSVGVEIVSKESVIVISDDEEVEIEKGRNTIKENPKDYIVDRVTRSSKTINVEEVEIEKRRNTIKENPKDYIVDRVTRSTNKTINLEGVGIVSKESIIVISDEEVEIEENNNSIEANPTETDYIVYYVPNSTEIESEDSIINETFLSEGAIAELDKEVDNFGINMIDDVSESTNIAKYSEVNEVFISKTASEFEERSENNNQIELERQNQSVIEKESIISKKKIDDSIIHPEVVLEEEIDNVQSKIKQLDAAIAVIEKEFITSKDEPTNLIAGTDVIPAEETILEKEISALIKEFDKKLMIVKQDETITSGEKDDNVIADTKVEKPVEETDDLITETKVAKLAEEITVFQEEIIALNKETITSNYDPKNLITKTIAIPAEETDVLEKEIITSEEKCTEEERLEKESVIFRQEAEDMISDTEVVKQQDEVITDREVSHPAEETVVLEKEIITSEEKYTQEKRLEKESVTFKQGAEDVISDTEVVKQQDEVITDTEVSNPVEEIVLEDESCACCKESNEKLIKVKQQTETIFIIQLEKDTITSEDKPNDLITETEVVKLVKEIDDLKTETSSFSKKSDEKLIGLKQQDNSIVVLRYDEEIITSKDLDTETEVVQRIKEVDVLEKEISTFNTVPDEKLITTTIFELESKESIASEKRVSDLVTETEDVKGAEETIVLEEKTSDERQDETIVQDKDSIAYENGANYSITERKVLEPAGETIILEKTISDEQLLVVEQLKTILLKKEHKTTEAEVVRPVEKPEVLENEIFTFNTVSGEKLPRLKQDEIILQEKEPVASEEVASDSNTETEVVKPVNETIVFEKEISHDLLSRIEQQVEAILLEKEIEISREEAKNADILEKDISAFYTESSEKQGETIVPKKGSINFDEGANDSITKTEYVKPAGETDILEKETSDFYTESNEKRQDKIVPEKEPITSDEGANDSITKTEIVKHAEETDILEKETSDFYTESDEKQQDKIVPEKEPITSDEGTNDSITKTEYVKLPEETDVSEKEISNFYTESDEKQQNEIVTEKEPNNNLITETEIVELVEENDGMEKKISSLKKKLAEFIKRKQKDGTIVSEKETITSGEEANDLTPKSIIEPVVLEEENFASSKHFNEKLTRVKQLGEESIELEKEFNIFSYEPKFSIAETDITKLAKGNSVLENGTSHSTKEFNEQLLRVEQINKANSLENEPITSREEVYNFTTSVKFVKPVEETAVFKKKISASIKGSSVQQTRVEQLDDVVSLQKETITSREETVVTEKEPETSREEVNNLITDIETIRPADETAFGKEISSFNKGFDEQGEAFLQEKEPESSRVNNTVVQSAVLEPEEKSSKVQQQEKDISSRDAPKNLVANVEDVTAVKDSVVLDKERRESDLALGNIHDYLDYTWSCMQLMPEDDFAHIMEILNREDPSIDTESVRQTDKERKIDELNQYSNIPESMPESKSLNRQDYSNLEVLNNESNEVSSIDTEQVRDTDKDTKIDELNQDISEIMPESKYRQEDTKVIQAENSESNKNLNADPLLQINKKQIIGDNPIKIFKGNEECRHKSTCRKRKSKSNDIQESKNDKFLSSKIIVDQKSVSEFDSSENQKPEIPEISSHSTSPKVQYSSRTESFDKSTSRKRKSKYNEIQGKNYKLLLPKVIVEMKSVSDFDNSENQKLEIPEISSLSKSPEEQDSSRTESIDAENDFVDDLEYLSSASSEVLDTDKGSVSKKRKKSSFFKLLFKYEFKLLSPHVIVKKSRLFKQYSPNLVSFDDLKNLPNEEPVNKKRKITSNPRLDNIIRNEEPNIPGLESQHSRNRGKVDGGNIWEPIYTRVFELEEEEFELLIPKLIVKKNNPRLFIPDFDRFNLRSNRQEEELSRFINALGLCRKENVTKIVKRQNDNQLKNREKAGLQPLRKSRNEPERTAEIKEPKKRFLLPLKRKIMVLERFDYIKPKEAEDIPQAPTIRESIIDSFNSTDSEEDFPVSEMKRKRGLPWRYDDS